MILLIFSLIIGISLLSLLGSWYIKKYKRPDLHIALYITFIFLSNILAFKLVSYDLGFTTLYAPSGVLIFSVTFLLTDIVNEKFGRKETQKMIFIAFLTQVITTLFILLAIYLTPAPFWNNQSVFQQVFGFVPRAIIASWVAFLISENADAYIFSWFKNITKNKHLWLRNAFSSIPSMALDTIIFVFIAYYNVQPTYTLIPLILSVILLKWLVAIIDIPFMYLNKWVMYYKNYKKIIKATF